MQPFDRIQSQTRHHRAIRPVTIVEQTMLNDTETNRRAAKKRYREALDQERTRLIAVLEDYANRKNWAQSDPDAYRHFLLGGDGWDRAEAALKTLVPPFDSSWLIEPAILESMKAADRRDIAEAKLRQRVREISWKPMPEPAAALHFYLMVQIKRIMWNLHGREWEPSERLDIPEIEYRPYREPRGRDLESQLPNFEFDGVGIRWRGEPGQKMQATRDLTAADWADWFGRCLAHLAEYEQEQIRQRPAVEDDDFDDWDDNNDE